MIRLENAKNNKKQIKHLYETAFPKEERAPLFSLYLATRHEKNNFYAIMDEDEFVGLMYTIRDRGIVYVFFLAIVEEKRGMGYGSRVLSLVKEMYPEDTITLLIEDTEETDADNYEQRIQRLKFYERNGFQQLHIRVNEVGVNFELLGTQKGITQSDFLALMRSYLGVILYKFIYRRTNFE